MERVGPTMSLSISDAHQFSNIRILLVEDNLINQQLMVEFLHLYRIAVEVVSNGKEAVDLLIRKRAQSAYDLIFMDCQMPVMDGYEATRLLRQMDEYKDIPILALSGHVLPQEIDNALQSGMNAFLAKPMDLNKVLKSIAAWTTGMDFSDTAAQQPPISHSAPAEIAKNHAEGQIDLSEGLCTLQEMIDNCNVDSLEIATELGNQYTHTEHSESLQLLAQALYDFDFQTAGAELTELKKKLL
jgi:CheY-like chemotaxis protein